MSEVIKVRVTKKEALERLFELGYYQMSGEFIVDVVEMASDVNHFIIKDGRGCTIPKSDCEIVSLTDEVKDDQPSPLDELIAPQKKINESMMNMEKVLQSGNIIIVTDKFGDKYEYDWTKEITLKIRHEWWFRYARGIENPKGLIIDEINGVDMGEWYLAQDGTHIDKNHVYTQEGYRALGSSAKHSCIEEMERQIKEQIQKDFEDHFNRTHDLLMESIRREKSGEPQKLDGVLKNITPRPDEIVVKEKEFVSLTNKANNCYPPEQEVKEWLENMSDLTGHDQNTKLTVWAFYYWMKSKNV